MSTSSFVPIPRQEVLLQILSALEELNEVLRALLVEQPNE